MILRYAIAALMLAGVGRFVWQAWSGWRTGRVKGAGLWNGGWVSASDDGLAFVATLVAHLFCALIFAGCAVALVVGLRPN